MPGSVSWGCRQRNLPVPLARLARWHNAGIEARQGVTLSACPVCLSVCLPALSYWLTAVSVSVSKDRCPSRCLQLWQKLLPVLPPVAGFQGRAAASSPAAGCLVCVPRSLPMVAERCSHRLAPEVHGLPPGHSRTPLQSDLSGACFRLVPSPAPGRGGLACQ